MLSSEWLDVKIIRILGAIEYHLALMMMKRTLRMRVRGEVEDHIYLLEHRPVITIGKDGKLSNIFSSYIDIPIFYVKRGGNVTLHSPGQLVVYPVIKIDEKRWSVRDMITMLENSVINVLKEYNLNGYWKKGTAGVWVNNRKIASVGLAIDHWTTYHGLAFNISNDLKLFEKIRPCGLPPTEMTNLEKEVKRKIDFEDTVKKYLKSMSSLTNDKIEIEQIYKKEIVNFLYE